MWEYPALCLLAVGLIHAEIGNRSCISQCTAGLLSSELNELWCQWFPVDLWGVHNEVTMETEAQYCGYNPRVYLACLIYLHPTNNELLFDHCLKSLMHVACQIVVCWSAAYGDCTFPGTLHFFGSNYHHMMVRMDFCGYWGFRFFFLLVPALCKNNVRQKYENDVRTECLSVLKCVPLSLCGRIQGGRRHVSRMKNTHDTVWEGNNPDKCVCVEVVCSGDSRVFRKPDGSGAVYPKWIHRLVLFSVSAAQLVSLLLWGEEREKADPTTPHPQTTHLKKRLCGEVFAYWAFDFTTISAHSLIFNVNSFKTWHLISFDCYSQESVYFEGSEQSSVGILDLITF